MDIKNTNAAQTTKTYNRDAIENQTENIYEAISIISKRAEQIKFSYPMPKVCLMLNYLHTH